MSKKVLIVQNYNINKGDTSVVFAMRNSMKKMYPDLDISLTSYSPDKAEREYELKSAEWLIDYSRIKGAGGVMKLIAALKELLWLFVSFFWVVSYKENKLKGIIPKRKRKTIELYENADAIVLPGGHFFTTLNRFPVVFSHYYAMWFAHKMGKKTMIYAQTIGPYKGTWAKRVKELTDKAIRFCDVVTVREEDSLKFDINKKMFLTAESVFAKESAPKSKDAQEYKKNGRKVVGLTIHHIYFAQFFSRDEYVKLMSDILNQIIKTHNCQILFIPMETYRSGNPGDRIMIKDIADKINFKGAYDIVDGDLTSSETESLIATTDVFVGTKTHSIVYGLKNCIPTLSIAYQEKSNQFMKSFDVLENSIDLEKLNTNDFMNIFDRIYESPEEYSDKQKSALDKIVSKAKENNTLLYNLIEK